MIMRINKEQIYMEDNHPLIGTWITWEEDSDLEIIIELNEGQIGVTSYDVSQKKKILISDLRYERDKLSFHSHISPEFTIRHVIKLRPDYNIDHELTKHEIWKRKGRKLISLQSVSNQLQQYNGTWVHDSDKHRNAEFHIKANGDNIAISGKDRSDGEKFVISNIDWDGQRLYFTSTMPSTNCVVKQSFTLMSDLKMDRECTMYEVWKKKS